LRLIPLAFSFAALPLFDRVARKFVEGPAHLLAVALFALGVPFIYYASQAKQYSGDVAATLIVILLAAELRRRTAPRVPVVWIGIVGSTLPWISQAAVFVLAGTGAVVAVHTIRERSRVCQTYACRSAPSTICTDSNRRPSRRCRNGLPRPERRAVRYEISGRVVNARRRGISHVSPLDGDHLSARA
jgi:hypothetical protein